MTTQSDAVSTRSGGSAVVEQLVREGVEVVFGIPGVQLMHILDSFHRGADRIRYITVRHEQATAFMADGYARVSGRPGTTLIVPGPGVYNAGSGLATAYAASSPVFQISGQINRDAIGRGNSLPHEVHDQLDVVRPITKHAERITEADQLPAAVRRAFAAMTSGRPRPAHLEIPPETMGELTSAPVVDSVAPEPHAARSGARGPGCPAAGRGRPSAVGRRRRGPRCCSCPSRSATPSPISDHLHSGGQGRDRRPRPPRRSARCSSTSASHRLSPTPMWCWRWEPASKASGWATATV